MELNGLVIDEASTSTNLNNDIEQLVEEEVILFDNDSNNLLSSDSEDINSTPQSESVDINKGDFFT